METILKQHNQIELPQDVCRTLELTPGIRFEIEIEKESGAIILQPIKKTMRLTRSKFNSSPAQSEITR